MTALDIESLTNMKWQRRAFLSKDVAERERKIEVRVASPRALRDQRGDFVIFWGHLAYNYKIFFFSPSLENQKSLVVTDPQCEVLAAILSLRGVDQAVTTCSNAPALNLSSQRGQHQMLRGQLASIFRRRQNG